MARIATTRLDSKTARLKLAPRSLPYFTSVARNVTLGYKRAASGAGTWIAREQVDRVQRTYRQRRIGIADDYAAADGKTILSFAQARALVAAGAFEEESQASATVAQAAAAYLDSLEAAKGAKAARDARQKIALHILPALGQVRLSELTTAQIQKWRDGLVRKDGDENKRRASRSSANRVLPVLKTMLNQAFAAGTIESDLAWRRVKAFRAVGSARQDHFSADEVQRLIDAAHTFDPCFANLVAAGFLTGARLGELTVLDVRHLDIKRGVLLVPSGKTGARAVTLTRDGLQFFAALAAGRAPGEPLLARMDGERWGRCDQHRPIKRALGLAGLPLSASFYSLRHSYISRAIESGVPLTVIAENTGTSLRMIECNYAHVLAHARRELLERAAPALRLVVSR